METLRKLVQNAMLLVDHLYHRWQRVQPVGEVLVTSRKEYRGEEIQLPDGTRVRPGDPIGTLHFLNARFTRLDGSTSRRAALQFARLMRSSLRELADKAANDPAFTDLNAYCAVSWLPPHGAQVGFITQPFPEGMRKRLLSTYLRFLVWAFAPARETRDSARPQPTVYWMTRRELLRQAGMNGAA